jgi:hypothetical protein
MGRAVSIHVTSCTYKGKLEYHLRYPGMSEEEAQELANKINAGALDCRERLTTSGIRPLQEDGESLDLLCRDYGGLERKHKQESWTDDQEDHYEAGWEAAVKYYFG